MPYAAFLFMVLATVGFFNYHGILTEAVQKLLFYVSVIAALALAVFRGNSLKDMSYPRKAYLVLMAGVTFTVIIPPIFHTQSLLATIVSMQAFIVPLTTFFIFMRFDLPPIKIVNTYIVLGVISGIVYGCNMYTMPNNIFGLPILNEDLTRGVVRVPIVFIDMMPMLVFYAINRWLIKPNYKWVLMGAFFMFLIFMSVTRQVILYTGVLGMLFLLRRVSWKIKVAICGGIAAVVLVVLPMIPVYQTMMELSEEQINENDDEENIRIQSWRYYTYEHQENAFTAIFGNGLPAFGKSQWGTAFESEIDENGTFYADVSLAGFYWLFGIFSTVAIFVMMIKALMRKKRDDLQFLNYSIVFFMLYSIAAGPLAYYYQIFSLMVILYMAFSRYNTVEEAPAPSASVPSVSAPAPKSRAWTLPRFKQLR